MPKLAIDVKRPSRSRPFRTSRVARTPLPTRIAGPVAASDVPPSVVCATEEIFRTPRVAGRSGDGVVAQRAAATSGDDD